jgi:hypothetical protein
MSTTLSAAVIGLQLYVSAFPQSSSFVKADKSTLESLRVKRSKQLDCSVFRDCVYSCRKLSVEDVVSRSITIRRCHCNKVMAHQVSLLCQHFSVYSFALWVRNKWLLLLYYSRSFRKEAAGESFCLDKKNYGTDNVPSWLMYLPLYWVLPSYRCLSIIIYCMGVSVIAIRLAWRLFFFIRFLSVNFSKYCERYRHENLG